MSKSFDVFVSHSTKNKPMADAVVHYLEERKIRCWIAPRDIGGGEVYGASIVNAIENSRLFLLIFSDDSNKSEQVWREIEHASDNKLPIIPFRVENIAPCSAVKYYIKNIHWLDVYDGALEGHLEELYKSISKNIDKNAVVFSEKTSSDKTEKSKNSAASDEQIKYYTDQGAEFIKTRQYDKALASFNTAFDLANESQADISKYGRIYALRGYCYMQTRIQDFTKAMCDLEKAIDIWPEFYAPYVNLAYVYRKSGEFDKALNILNKALERDLKPGAIYCHRGNLYKELGQIEKADDDFKMAKDIDPVYFENNTEADK